MTELVVGLHRIVAVGLDLFFRPCVFFSPLWRLTLVSAVSGVVLLVLYGWCSSQRRIRATKERIGALLLEVLLFRHDPRLCLRAQGRLFIEGGKYLLVAFPAILILAVPCVFLLAQLNLRFGFRGLAVGEPAIVQISVRAPSFLDRLSLVAHEGLEVTPPLRIVEPPEVLWRVRPVDRTAEGTVKVVIRDGERFELPVEIARAERADMVPGEFSRDWLGQLLLPGELIPGEMARMVNRVRISYPKQLFTIGGVELPWTVVFFLVSLGSALVASRFLRVEI